MKTYTRFFTAMFLFCGGFFLAQISGITLETEKSVATTNEELLTIMVKLENNSGNVYELQLISEGDKGFRILNKSISVKLQPQEKIFVPVKIFIEKTQSAGSSVVEFKVTDENKKTLAAGVTKFTIATKRSVRLIANDPQLIIERMGDSLRVSTQVFNAGNEMEHMEIVATFPQGYNRNHTLTKKIALEPFSNREVVFSKIIDKEMLNLEIFNVNIVGKTADGNIVGNASIMVQNALGNRRYIDPLNLNKYLLRSSPNRIAWSTSNPFSEFSATHNLNVQTEVNVGNTKAAISANGTYYPQRGGELMLQDAWLKLENGPFGLQIGNLSGTDLEISLNGRGAEFSYNPVNLKNISFSAGAVEKSYNLFDPFTDSSRGYAAFAKTTYGLNENKNVNSQVIIDTDPFQQGFIFKNGYEFNNYKDTDYRLDMGYGYARSVPDKDVAKSSVFLGLTYNKKWDKYVFSSNNYHGSGYYPGLKRGSTVFEQRLSRNFKKLSVYAGYSLNIFEPQNIDPSYPYNSSSKRSRIEAGSSFSLAEGVSMSISSAVAGENSQLFLATLLGQTTVNFRSAVLRTAINYSPPGNRDRIGLIYSQGVSYYRGLSRPQFISQWQANWYHGNLSLSGNYQQGVFMLYEGNANGILNSEIEKFSAIASYRLALLNKKLNVNINAFSNFESSTGNSISFSTAIDYRIFRSTQIFANINYNRYSRNEFTTANTFYQIGVSQELPTIGEEAVKYKNGVLKIFLFFDLDNDNAYNPTVDRPAPHMKVKINNTIFISGEDGNITYRKVPYGIYTVKNLDSNWYATEQKIELSQKEAFVIIPLEKTSVVQGQVEYQQTTKMQYEVQEILAGIPVIFKNQAEKIFTFYTNAQGQYTAYLPVGKYKVSIDSSVLQKNVYLDDNQQSVTAEEERLSVLEKFIFKVREKKVEIKRFGS